MREECWGDRYLTGAKGQPAFHFELDFQDLPDESVARVRASAERFLRDYGESRSLVRNTGRAIAHLCTVRLTHPPGLPANHWIVQAVWDPMDDAEAVQGDRARITTWASRMVTDESDNAAALVWGEIAEGFQREPFRPK
jgi:hypothetical protein